MGYIEFYFKVRIYVSLVSAYNVMVLLVCWFIFGLVSVCPECFCWSWSLLFGGWPLWSFMVGVSVASAMLISRIQGMFYAAGWCQHSWLLWQEVNMASSFRFNLYTCISSFLVLLSHHSGMTSWITKKKTCLDKVVIEYLTANQRWGTMTKQTRKMITGKNKLHFHCTRDWSSKVDWRASQIWEFMTTEQLTILTKSCFQTPNWCQSGYN
jgi:hypothetical protein